MQDKKYKTITIRVSEDEYNTIKTNAYKDMLDISKYIRIKLLGENNDKK